MRRRAKKCKKCGSHKDLTDFPRITSSNGKKYHRGTCKPCMNVHHKTWRREKMWVIEEVKKNGSCLVCNERHPATLEFHHLRHEDKEFAIGQAPTADVAKLRDEMAKCVLLCANCHRKYHKGDEPTEEKVHYYRDNEWKLY